MSILLLSDQTVYIDRAGVRGVDDTGWLASSSYVIEEVDKTFRSPDNRFTVLKLGAVLQSQKEIDFLLELVGWVVSTPPLSETVNPDGLADTERIRKFDKTFTKAKVDGYRKKGIFNSLYFVTAEGFHSLTVTVNQKELKIDVVRKSNEHYFVDGSMTELVVNLLQCGYSPEKAVALGTEYHCLSYPYGVDKVEFSDHVKMK